MNSGAAHWTPSPPSSAGVMSIHELARAFRQRLANVVEYTDINYALYSGKSPFPTVEYCGLVRNALENSNPDLQFTGEMTESEQFYMRNDKDVHIGEEDVNELLEKYTTLSAAPEPDVPSTTDVDTSREAGPSVYCTTERSDASLPPSPTLFSFEYQFPVSKLPDLGDNRAPATRRQTKCSFCARVFKRPHDCKRHENTHTNTTPYRCFGCEKAFKRSDARARHWKQDPQCKQLDERHADRTTGRKRRKRD